MDTTFSAGQFVASGLTGVIISVCYIVYKACKHSNCKSKCCGQTSEFAIDLEANLKPPSPSSSTGS